MREGTPESYQERILRVMVYIQTHLDDPLTLDDLARVACFSPYHFHRIFRGLVGEPVAEHLRRLRLERAAGRLKFTDRQVIDIALDAGYDSHEAFTRAFRSNFGRAPSVYRSEAAITAPPSGGPWIEVQVEKVPSTRVAFMRHVGGYDDVGTTWARLFSWIVPRGLFRADTRTIGICHDDPEVAPLDKCRYDAAVTGRWTRRVKATLAFRRFPAAYMPSRSTRADTPGWRRPTRACAASGCPGADTNWPPRRRWRCT